MKISTPNHPKRKANSGFTIIDLVAVTAIIAILAGLLLPALSATQNASYGMLCLNNKKQLIIGFSTYSTDNLGRFPGNYHGGQAQNPDGLTAAEKSTAPWAVGWQDWGSSPANTNTQYLTNPKYARLSPYLGYKASIFKCPADQYLSAVQLRNGWTQRVRSISANIGVGQGNAEGGPWDSYFTHVTKFSDMVKPAPSDVWVYLDEHPDSMNDTAFFNPMVSSWIDLPASFHEGAGSFAFADGRAELHKWQASAKGARITTTQFIGVTPRPNDLDVLWMRARASHR